MMILTLHVINIWEIYVSVILRCLLVCMDTRIAFKSSHLHKRTIEVGVD